MEPLSLNTRRTYAVVSSIAFLVVVFFALLYASGYQLKGFSVIETGAIHVSLTGPNAIVSLNGEVVGRSSLLSRGLFLDNLAPGTYRIEAAAEGYHPWIKNLVVHPSVVTEASAYLMPTTFSLERVPALRPLPTPSATSTRGDIEGGLELSVEEGRAYLRWTRQSDSVPAAFCLAPQSCVVEMVVVTGGVEDARFFSGGVVYQSAGGVYLTEADVKEPRVLVAVYEVPGATFRIERNRLYVMSATSTYEVGGY